MWTYHANRDSNLLQWSDRNTTHLYSFTDPCTISFHTWQYVTNVCGTDSLLANDFTRLTCISSNRSSGSNYRVKLQPRIVYPFRSQNSELQTLQLWQYVTVLHTAIEWNVSFFLPSNCTHRHANHTHYNTRRLGIGDIHISNTCRLETHSH